MVNTKVNLSGWELDNPVIPASGTFGYGKEFAELYDINILGTFSFKGTTVEPRFGNPTPRIAESDTGIINSIGLQNPGMEHVIAHELPEMKKFFRKKVIANVSGFSVDDYVKLCEAFGKQEQVGILEVNVSCPNVNGDGLPIGTSCDNVYDITKAVKNVTDKPIYVKLSPNVTDIAAIARSAEEAGADGISLINTMTGMRINLKTMRPIITPCSRSFGGKAAHHRHRRRKFGGRRFGNDDGGSDRRRSGSGKPFGPVRLQNHNRRPARGHAKVQNQQSKRYNRRSAQWQLTL